MGNRYRLYETADLIKIRGTTYGNLLLDDRLGYRMLAAGDRQDLREIDRELRRRKRHQPATPEKN